VEGGRHSIVFAEQNHWTRHVAASSARWLSVFAVPGGQLTRTRLIASFTALPMRETSDCGLSWSA
jgi:hypothetical protein